MKKENLALGLSGIAVLISIACCFIRIEPVSYDYMGILVGVLSLLVTALIGWQIYNAVFWRNDIDNKINKRIKNETLYAVKAINLLMYKSYQTSLIGHLKSKDWFKVIIIQDSMIGILITIRDEELISSIVRHTYNLLEYINEFDEAEILELKEYIEHFKELSKYSDEVIDLYVFANNKLIQY